MIVKLLTEHHLEFLSLKEAAQAGLNVHLSKYHIVGNHMSRLKKRILGERLLISGKASTMHVESQAQHITNRICKQAALRTA